MLDQPLNGSSLVSKQLGRNARPSDTQVHVAHHASERAAVDKERERKEAVDQRLAGVMMPRIGIERLRVTDVDEQGALTITSRSPLRWMSAVFVSGIAA
jgi:hypothetical protein